MHFHACLQLRAVRPMTTGDFVRAVALMKEHPTFRGLTILPEPICEGGFEFRGLPGATEKTYKSVRLSGNSRWPVIADRDAVLRNWSAGDGTLVVYDMSTPYQLVQRRQRRARGADVTLVCKCSSDQPKWTRDDLDAVAYALIATGAFAPQQRRRVSRLVY